ncbi:hypothetical protein [Nostoc linckia]|uniref:hypothetical protein n=1 Tax=Nostoc linckia TaxID=92942 RepID=UPI00117F9779|nr:hypothetical protein [Nostoc linckia]
MLELRDILETQYQDGITAIPQAQLNEDDSFSGIFLDRVNSKLTKRFKFEINDDEISYSLVNPGDVGDFTEEGLDFAQKKASNCTKGIACGGSCISAKKTCRKNADAPTKKKISQVRTKVKGGSSSPQKTKSSGGSGGFPSDPSKLEVVKPLGGSTGAVLVRDPKTGKLFVRKTGDSPEHLRSEASADNAYRALGVNVPKQKLYETPDGPVKLAEYVEGKSMKEVIEKGTPAEKKKLLAELKKNYTADALLGNWDVVGQEKDNIILGKDGKVYRVDNGGALGYRAQGAKKTDEQWNKYPTELWSMRDKSVNPQAAEAFAGMKHKEIVQQIDAIAVKQKQLLAAVPPDVRETLKGRIEEMQRVAQISKTLEDDDWNDNYISTFTKHTVGIRTVGITGKLPKSLKGEGNDVILKDENGKEFDNLRGKNSTMKDFEEYVQKNGGNYEVASTWMDKQAGSSWSDGAQAYKYHLAEQRGGSKDNYYWSDGEESAKQAYKKYVKEAGGQSKYSETMAAYHAFNYELLTKTDFPNKNSDGTITLVRTENKAVMDMYGHKVGDTDIIMKRGVAESTSLVQAISVYGNELTVQKVPPHRVVGVYFHERHPGKGGSAFMGDYENEFVAILDKVPFKYTKTIDADDDDDAGLLKTLFSN